MFTRTKGIWTQQGGKLVGTGPNPQGTQGKVVALSGDGNTAISSAPQDATSAFWVFARNSGVWAQEGSKLPVSGPNQAPDVGYSVALSLHGDTAIAGAPGENNYNGSAWIFKRMDGSWAQRGKLQGTGAIGPAGQGYSVALSGEGTVVIGGVADNSSIGAAWVFTSPEDPLLYEPLTGTAYRAFSNGDGTFQYVYNLFSPAFDTLRTGNFTGNGKAADLVLYNSHTGLGYIGIGNLDGTYNFNSLFWSPGLWHC